MKQGNAGVDEEEETSGLKVPFLERSAITLRIPNICLQIKIL